MNNNWYELHFNKNEPSKVMESDDIEKIKAEGIKIIESLGEDKDDEYCWLMLYEWNAEDYAQALQQKIENGWDEIITKYTNYYIYSKKRNGWINPVTYATL